MERFQYQLKFQYRTILNSFYVEVYLFEESPKRQAVLLWNLHALKHLSFYEE